MTVVKYLYVRDPQEPKRVLSIARVKEAENTFRFAIAQNLVTKSWWGDSVVHDVFVKKTAHKILQGRLEKNVKTFTISVPEGQFVGPAILAYLALQPEGVPRAISKTAKRALTEGPPKRSPRRLSLGERRLALPATIVEKG